MMLIGTLLGLVYYVVSSYAHMKALRRLGYDKAWLAWIPYGVWYACADAVTDSESPVQLFGKYEISVSIFKLWWLASLAMMLLQRDGSMATLINLALQFVFLGHTYAKMFAALEGRTEEEMRAVGCISGVLPIVAVVKFLIR